MKTRRQALIQGASAVAALGLGHLPALAQAIPDTLRIVVGFPPGGTTDAFARRIGEKLRIQIKANRRNVARLVAAEQVARAANLKIRERQLESGAEVRRINLVPKDAFPYKNANGTVYDSGDYPGSLDLAVKAANYDALRAEQRRRRENGDRVQLGIGVAVYVEITAMSGGSELGMVEVLLDESGEVAAPRELFAR